METVDSIIKGKFKDSLKTFDEVRNYLDSVEEINAGGCGVAALAMYRWLKKMNLLKGDEYFVFCFSSKHAQNYKNNKRFLDLDSLVADSASHIYLNYGGWCYDSYDKIKYVCYTTYLEVTEEHLLNSLNFGGWNSTFDRKYVKEIMDVLDIDLTDVAVCCDKETSEQIFFK